jgi:hypothetical protein
MQNTTMAKMLRLDDGLGHRPWQLLDGRPHRANAMITEPA